MNVNRKDFDSITLIEKILIPYVKSLNSRVIEEVNIDYDFSRNLLVQKVVDQSFKTKKRIKIDEEKKKEFLGFMYRLHDIGKDYLILEEDIEQLEHHRKRCFDFDEAEGQNQQLLDDTHQTLYWNLYFQSKKMLGVFLPLPEEEKFQKLDLKYMNVFAYTIEDLDQLMQNELAVNVFEGKRKFDIQNANNAIKRTPSTRSTVILDDDDDDDMDITVDGLLKALEHISELHN